MPVFVRYLKRERNAQQKKKKKKRENNNTGAHSYIVNKIHILYIYPKYCFSKYSWVCFIALRLEVWGRTDHERIFKLHTMLWILSLVLFWNVWNTKEQKHEERNLVMRGRKRSSSLVACLWDTWIRCCVMCVSELHDIWDQQKIKIKKNRKKKDKIEKHLYFSDDWELMIHLFLLHYSA